MKKIDGALRADGLRAVLVVSRFNSFVTDHLVSGAADTLRRLGVREEDITVIHVPGAFEIPAALKKKALSGDCDLALALGCVIRGATPHFDYVASQCAAGVAEVALAAADLGVAVGFGVLTTDTIEQAIERAGTKAGNKGADAALAAVEMVQVFRQLGGSKR